jgi:hypothetical protein
LTLAKTASPTQLPKSGGNVTFTLVIQNTTPMAIAITSITDSVFGNIDGKGDCSVASANPLAGNGSYTCSFAEFVTPDHKNTATVRGAVGPVSVDASDDAEVTTMPSVPALGPSSPLGPSWGVLALFGLLLSVGAWLTSRRSELGGRR